MERQTKSLKKNIIYQVLYQAVMFIIPLIVSPFLTRTLKADALGVYSFTYSIAYYFVIFAMLGISRYGQRLIASIRNDKNKLQRAFWSLYCTHVVMSIFAVILYIIIIIVFQPADSIIYWIQTFYVVSALFDVTWLFYGLENFKSVIVKNFFVKLLELILIFVLVRVPSDLWKYTLITSTSILLGHISLAPQTLRTIPFARFTWKDAKVHIKPLLTLWIVVLASTMYTVFDKTLLGIMTEKKNVAFYEYANKLVKVPVFLLSAISTVTYPRMCYLVAEKKDISAQNSIFSNSILLTSFIGFAATAIIIAIADDFIYLYYGPEFAISGNVMIYLSPIIAFISIGDIIRTQIMIPRNMDKQFVITICINALVNLVLSAVFIPVLGILGTVLGTVAAETCGLILIIVICRKYIDFAGFWKKIIPFAINAIIAVFIVTVFKNVSNLESRFLSVIMQFCISGFVYLLLSCIYIYITKQYKFVSNDN